MRTNSIFRGALAVLLLATAACSDDSTTAPLPAASLTIAPPATTVYEQDATVMTAVLRDAQGRIVTGAPITWSVSDTTRAELGAAGYLLALKPGSVRVTARSGNSTASYDLAIAPLTVQTVTVMPLATQFAKGDVVSIGVKLEGQGGRRVLGRLVTLASDQPSIVTIDASGRMRGVNAGTATIRATSDGVTGTAQVVVSAENAVLELSQLNGARLPRLVAADSVTWDGQREFHEVYMEFGALVLSGSAQPRYEIDVRYAEYRVATVNGQRSMQLVRTSREYDRGIVQYDARGDLLMTSEYISPLSHTASPVSGGFLVRFRVPGDDEILELFYRRQPA